jgi:hypothetical protein
VDGSSGAIGTAVNHAVEALVAIIAGAPADAKTREGWLDRLWDAHANDEIPYIERLGDFWASVDTSKPAIRGQGKTGQRSGRSRPSVL